MARVLPFAATLSGRGTVQPVDSLDECHRRVRRSYARFAANVRRRRELRAGYLAELVRRYRFYVEPGARVLEVGVGTGDLLASLDAAHAVGVDISPEMLEVARATHPQLELHLTSAEELAGVEGPFDYVILSDLTVHVYDILRVLRSIARLCHERTRVVVNFHSRLWQPALELLTAAGLHHQRQRTNWATVEDMANLLGLADFEVLKTDSSTLLPMNLGPLSTLANRYLHRLPGVDRASLVNWMVARPAATARAATDLTVSVVCAARNEAGHIAEIVRRLPRMGRGTQLIFVEGGSSDDTFEKIKEEIDEHNRADLDISLHRQPGTGKGDAVRAGFARARGDVLMILDADLTVPPEDLPQFVEALAAGKGEFINGVRLVYPMNEKAMRFLNILGNKFFARSFSYLLGQRIKDTLCGTKVLMADDYARIARGRSYFGDFDPFGDFDLLFGAAKLNLKIVDIPIRYRERTYGDTNINRFRDGALLLRMSWFALNRLKFL